MKMHLKSLTVDIKRTNEQTESWHAFFCFYQMITKSEKDAIWIAIKEPVSSAIKGKFLNGVHISRCS